MKRIINISLRRIYTIIVLMMITACVGATGSGAPGADSSQPGELGGMCGGIAGFQCKAEGAYCQVETGACHEIADYAGVCRIKPEFCTMDYRPVCGCDGQSYGNRCTAAAEGVSVAYEGTCKEQN